MTTSATVADSPPALDRATPRRRSPLSRLWRFARNKPLGFIGLVIVDATGGTGGTAGAVILNIAVWGAVLAYLLQMVSFVLLRRKFPNAVRPYRSPWGVPGAVVAGAIALIIFLGLAINPAFFIAIVAIAIIYAIGLVLFAVWGRKQLVLSPEEEYAVSGGLHRDPKTEHYGD